MTYDRIRELPKDIADKIAAGEVVERPLSIVKELVENSIDAGAGRITVEIAAGGKQYIRVTDDGKGIPKDQLPLAVRRYASSKIYTEEDLDSIETLGFRGEALASIGSVSALEIISKPAAQAKGASIRVEGGEESAPADTACEDGTTVIVRDLFFNVPARLKFMKQDAAETALITEFVSKAAIARPDIRFRMISNGTILFSTTGKGDLRQAILTVYSRNISNELLPVGYGTEGVSVKGYVSAPLKSRSSRKYQIYYVNGRLVRSKLIDGALDRAYRDKLFEGRYPVAILFIDVPPQSIDVNIHPSKTEIRFYDEPLIASAVITAVRQALLDPAALAVTEPELGESSEDIMRDLFGAEDIKRDLSGAEDALSLSHSVSEPEKGAACGEYASGKGDPKGYEEDQLRLEISLPGRSPALEKLRALREAGGPAEVPETDSFMMNEAPGRYSEEERFSFSSLSISDVYFNSYIAAKDDDHVYFIDQHAAHERVMFERLTGRFEGAQAGSQLLLSPLVITVGASAGPLLQTLLPQLTALGFDAEEFGASDIIVRAVPSCMDLSEAESFLESVFESDPSELRSFELKRDDIISNACKAAVKAGDRLTEEEIAELFAALDLCENPMSCPHGRPTMIRFSPYEFERLFKRR